MHHQIQTTAVYIVQVYLVAHIPQQFIELDPEFESCNSKQLRVFLSQLKFCEIDLPSSSLSAFYLLVDSPKEFRLQEKEAHKAKG